VVDQSPNHFCASLPLQHPGAANGAYTRKSSFLWVPIATNSVEMRNIQAGLSYFQELYPMRYSDIMAASTLAAIPMIIVFFSFQKYFLKG
jgi:multiple sugar transport system permease protein